VECDWLWEFQTGVVGKDGGCVRNRPPPPKKLGKTPSIDMGFAWFCMVLLAHVLTENQRMSSSEGMHETEEGGSFETLAATAAMLILVRRWGPWTLHIYHVLEKYWPTI